MLVDPVFVLDAHDKMILSLIGGGDPKPERITKGVFRVSHYNLDSMIIFPEPELDYRYPEFQDRFHECIPPDQEDLEHGYFNSYGVCDNPDQFMGLVGDMLEKDERSFVVSVTHISKDPEMGWRWHKWGPYIGTGDHRCEYLAEEVGFEDGVFVYHVYQLAGPLFVPDWKRRIQEANKKEKEKASEAKVDS